MAKEDKLQYVSRQGDIPNIPRIILSFEMLDTQDWDRPFEERNVRAKLIHDFIVRVIDKKTGKEVEYEYGKKRDRGILTRESVFHNPDMKYYVFPFIKVKQPVSRSEFIHLSDEEKTDGMWQADELPLHECADVRMGKDLSKLDVRMRKEVLKKSDFVVLFAHFKTVLQTYKADDLTTPQDMAHLNQLGHEEGRARLMEIVSDERRNWKINTSYYLSDAIISIEDEEGDQTKRFWAPTRYENPEDAKGLPKGWGAETVQQYSFWCDNMPNWYYNEGMDVKYERELLDFLEKGNKVKRKPKISSSDLMLRKSKQDIYDMLANKDLAKDFLEKSVGVLRYPYDI